MIDFPQSTQSPPPDPLFLERLQAFMDKSLADIVTFSERENKVVEETRRYVAEWHCRYLFAGGDGVTKKARREYICPILRETSRRLESLDKLTNTQSFFLTIDPNDLTDQGFLGGTILGREFWRGLRGGGDAGAKNFRAFCLKHTGQNTLRAVPDRTSVSGENVANVPLPSHTKRGPASELKAQVYSAVRDTLRATSRVRTAEMKWTNHARLESLYHVQLVGWPTNVPVQNPSGMTVGQMNTLLGALRDGSLKFKRVGMGEEDETSAGGGGGERGEVARVRDGGDVDEEDISWAIQEAEPLTPTNLLHSVAKQPMHAGPSRIPDHEIYEPVNLPDSSGFDPSSHLVDSDTFWTPSEQYDDGPQWLSDTAVIERTVKKRRLKS